MSVDFEVGNPSEPRTMTYKTSEHAWIPASGEKVSVPHNSTVLHVNCSNWPEMCQTIRNCRVAALETLYQQSLEEEILEISKKTQKLNEKQDKFKAIQSFHNIRFDPNWQLFEQKKELETVTPHLKETYDKCQLDYQHVQTKLEYLDSNIQGTSDELRGLEMAHQDNLNRLKPLAEQLKSVFDNEPELGEQIISSVQGENSIQNSSFSSDPGEYVDPNSIEALLSSKLVRMKVERVKLLSQSFELEKKVEQETLAKERQNYLLEDIDKEISGYSYLLDLSRSAPVQQMCIERSGSSMCVEKSVTEKSSKLDELARERKLLAERFGGKDNRDIAEGERLMNFIVLAGGSSRKNIIGPLRMHIRFSNKATDSQKHLVLAYLHEHLTTYLVECPVDKAYLERKKHQFNARMVKVVSYKPSQQDPEVFEGSMPTILDLLVIGDARVRDYLISTLNVHLIGVSPLRSLPKKGLFVDPKSSQQTSADDHIQGCTLILSQNNRFVRTTAVLSEQEFSDNSSFLDMTRLKAFEITHDVASRMINTKTQLSELRKTQEETCKSHHLSLETTKGLHCEALGTIDKLSNNIDRHTQLEKSCVELQLAFQVNKNRRDSAGEQLSNFQSERVGLQKRRDSLAKKRDEANRAFKSKSDQLRKLKSDKKLAEAEQLNKSYNETITQFGKKFPNINLVEEAKDQAANSVAGRLEALAEEVERLKNREESHKKLKNEGYVSNDAICEYLAKLNFKLETVDKLFDEKVSSAAIATVINQMDCPTVFVDGDIEVNPSKQLIIVNPKRK
ncbi:hypothetical protein CJU89_6798 [Yarrowia sp. B02]|nr:hypothetical protein CJU89_6798 [Yarrowia sp. B02]